jgi:hypothetical protein
MDVIKSLVADNLKTLITTDSKLKDCLFELKSFYLMGDGDFWHIFIQRANKLIKTPLNQASEDVLNSLLFKETLT